MDSETCTDPGRGSGWESWWNVSVWRAESLPESLMVWGMVSTLSLWSAPGVGEGHHLQMCEPRVSIPALMTGSLPRCEGRRGRAGVQLWPQGGVESPASQQYSPGWAQLFLETERRGWGPQTSWGLLVQTCTLSLMEAFRSFPKLWGSLHRKWGV